MANHVGEKADLLSVPRLLARVLRSCEGQRRQEGDPPSERRDRAFPQQSLHPGDSALLHLSVDGDVGDASGVRGRRHGGDGLWSHSAGLCDVDGGEVDEIVVERVIVRRVVMEVVELVHVAVSLVSGGVGVGVVGIVAVSVKDVIVMVIIVMVIIVMVVIVITTKDIILLIIIMISLMIIIIITISLVTITRSILIAIPIIHTISLTISLIITISLTISLTITISLIITISLRDTHSPLTLPLAHIQQVVTLTLPLRRRRRVQSAPHTPVMLARAAPPLAPAATHVQPQPRGLLQPRTPAHVVAE